ncbi:MAG: DUF4416 family protein [Planctomycetes bacterium]|nr:DUF4416 family protein [Planctomycetota bacterium]
MKPVAPEPVKLFIGLLAAGEEAVDEARRRCVERFGPLDYESPPIPFTFTNYYEAEMGSDLRRFFWSFERLIDPSEIVDAKQRTNEIEDASARDGRRAVNLDPGYVDTYKVILATAKGAGQKVYLREGIWADCVLHFVKGRVKFFDWGFPDYKSGAYDKVLLRIRELYKIQRRGGLHRT